MAATETAKLDKRQVDSEIYPVWERKLELVTIAGGHVEISVAIDLNGLLQKIIMVVPATQATGQSATLTIDDGNDVEIFNSGAKAEGDTYIFNVSDPLCGNIDISIDFAGSVGSTNHTTTVYLRGV